LENGVENAFQNQHPTEEEALQVQTQTLACLMPSFLQELSDHKKQNEGERQSEGEVSELSFEAEKAVERVVENEGDEAS
jgi:hypothetical protein